MKIVVPDKMGDDLRLIPASIYTATFKEAFVGTSQAKQPKMTVRWIITSEPQDELADPPTTGETLLDSYSLQENSMWRFNKTFRALTGNNLPQQDFDENSFQAFVNETLVGTEAVLDVGVEPRADTGEERNRVNKVSKA